MTREDIESGNVWPDELLPALDSIASELSRIGDYLESLASHFVYADTTRDNWRAAEQAALLREAKGDS